MKMVMLVLVVGIASASCNTGSNQSKQNGSFEQKKTQPEAPQGTNLMASDKVRPYFQLSDQELRSLIANVRKVQLGDTRQKVKELLGEPCSDDLVAPKETNTPIGRFVTYCATKQDKNLVNERLDKSVMFRFDTSDRLTKIISTVPGIPNRP
jgi:hypothetical protein